MSATEARPGPRTATNETFALTGQPLNCWYVAAWDVEVGRELLARTIASRDIVLYRRRDGRPVAMDDACWHRLLPLSAGRLEGDRVACGYHGLVYDGDGRCVFMPSQQTINPAARVRSYPVVERHRFVWIWLGDPSLADPDEVPDMHHNDDPEWTGDGKVIHAQCNYKLVVDNLMDLTHETFVHGGSIGQSAVAEVPFEVSHGEHSAMVTRWMTDIDPPPFLKMQLEWKAREPAGRVDRWQIIHFTPPSTVVIDVGVAPTGTGAPEGDRSAGINNMILNTITPETGSTCHYFWAIARNWCTDDQRLTTTQREGNAGVFAQDEVVLAAQQAAIDANPDKDFYNLNIDAGSMWARRLIDAMIAREGDDERYQRSAEHLERTHGATTHVVATDGDVARLRELGGDADGPDGGGRGR